MVDRQARITTFACFKFQNFKKQTGKIWDNQNANSPNSVRANAAAQINLNFRS